MTGAFCGNVFIAEPNEEYEQMFKDQGWGIVFDLLEADLVQLTGGEDVNPSMYNEHRHPKTYFNSRRDDQDFAVARYAMKHNIPLAGICRGGQFLNVLNKGSMWQDVSGHALNAKHMMRDHWNDIKLPVTSTHHQMMMPGANGLIIGTAIESERRERVNKKIPGSIHTNIIRTREHLTWSDSDVDQDIEIVWYPDTDSLCYQPHPEFKGEIELRNHYFLLLEQLFYDTLDIKKVSNDK